jgi:hypothetical protein
VATSTSSAEGVAAGESGVRAHPAMEGGVAGDGGQAEQQGISAMSSGGRVWSGGEVEQVSSNPRQQK